MQLFVFAKQLMATMRKEKEALLAPDPSLSSDGRRSFSIGLHAKPVYEEGREPNEIMLDIVPLVGGRAKQQRQPITIPEGMQLMPGKEVEKWLADALEFAGKAHEIAIRRAIEETKASHTIPLKVHSYTQGMNLETKLILSKGALKDLPLEVAMFEMDKLQKQTLTGWKTSKKNEDNAYKTFDTPKEAALVHDLLTLILKVNGKEERELKKQIKLTANEETRKFQVKLPKDLLDIAQSAEQYIDFP